MKNKIPAIKRSMNILWVVIGFAAFTAPNAVLAQKASPHDTSYYKDFPGSVTARFYFSQKYAGFTIPGPAKAKDLEYIPNTKLNMGIGATYHNFSLNLAYGFGFLNKDEEKGKTKGLDVELHLYPHGWAIDALGIFHKGNYLEPLAYLTHDGTAYYYRPDVKMDLIGLSAYRVANAEKFSYRAAMTQNEWQTKSAGSVLYGGLVNYGLISGDSALVPQQIENGYTQAGIDNIHFITAGAGIGYAYTLVMARHFFITGSLIGNLSANFTTEDGENGKTNKVSAGPSAIYKAAAGYNSNTWDVSASWAGNATWIKGASSTQDYFMPTGNFRVTFAKKIMPRHTLLIPAR